ncbi:hypothetical protein MADA3029_1170018 [Vibrio nigripulchritudo MADA3029]|nr:hypothetical protein VIBNIMADA3020_600092 [Vibrio nigripulchritudo MADA3020]CCN52817.1 hypothetical protein VIBNIMADA3021_150091 [Vibrio nigripulchritudo MADA3021]CCN57692.1 hypothetical protein MADA3029_1170018 [Vibrio nigripulchritudo MADA3029]
MAHFLQTFRNIETELNRVKSSVNRYAIGHKGVINALRVCL